MKRVLFFAPFGSYTVHHQLDAVVATALRLRGADALVVRCDRLYEVCDVLAWSGDQAEQDCANCQFSGDQLFSAFQLPIAQLRAHLNPEDFQRSEEWISGFDPKDYSNAAFQDVEIGKWVTSSTYSHFRITAAELDQPHVQKVHRAYLKQGLLTFWALERIVSQYAPDAMMVFNGRFAPYSVAFQVARRHNIPVVVHERGMADETFVFTNNYTSVHAAPILECTKAWMHVPLIESELKRTKQYFINRELGHDSNYKPFFEYRADYAEVRRKLDIPASARIFAVLTSSEFELAFSDDFRGVTQQLDVVETLIDIFKNRSDYLVIRHHPLISKDPETNPDWGFLSRALQQARNAPSNVKILMPSETFSTYELIPSISAGIAFISTIGIEAAARGVAMASFPESLYRPALPFGVPSAKRSELEDLVNNLFDHESKFGIKDLQNIYRYTHGYVEHFSVGFKSFGMNALYQPNIRFNSLDELQAGFDPALDRICEYFLHNSEVMDMPGPEDLARSDAEEIQFFEAELEAIKELRANTQKQAQFLSQASADIKSVAIFSTLPGDAKQLNWMRKQRYKYWDFTQTDSLNLRTIYDLVSKSTRDFIIIADGDFWYDQACFSSAVELMRDQSKNLTWIGAAVHTSKGELYAEDFTNRAARTFRSTQRNLSLPARTLPYLLSFVIWRREFLAQWLEQMKSINNLETVCKSLLDLRTREDVVLIEYPLAYVSHN